MKYIMNKIKYKEYIAKREALFRLRGLTDRMLIDCNISPELLQKGIKAWPWQATPDTEIMYTPLQYLKQMKPQASLHVDAPLMEHDISIEQGSLNVQAAKNKQTANSAIDPALELEQEPKVQRSAA